MKLKNILESKLKSYSALSIGVLAAGSASAQIKYHDIAPDKVVNLNDSFFVDMNQDGNNELKFVNMVVTYGGFTINMFGPVVLNDGEVLAMNSNFQGLSGTSSTYVAQKLNLNDSINGDQSYWLGGSSSSYPAIMFGKTTIGPLTIKVGKWERATDKFLGVRFHMNADTNWYYGWVRLDVTNDTNFVVKDFAYESTANKYILAGLQVSGIEKEESTFGIFINHKNLIIRNSDINSKGALTVYNTNGELLLSNSVETPYSEFDVSHFPAGVYIVKIQTGTAVITKKVILN
jgi:hypothetical protein